ncbi:MAG: DUF5722 domain-containing protein [Oscillospiraceae bacterium]|nr:DUF5722 domain-containing protein [Oscillospiraceae bacterium]
MIRKFIYILFFTIFISVLFCVNVSAAAQPVVISSINAAAATNQIDLPVDRLENAMPAGWTAQENTQFAGVTQSLLIFPFTPFEGSNCLAVQSTDVSVDSPRSVTRDFEISLNLNDYNIFFFAVNLPELAPEYNVTLNLYGENSSYSAAASNLKSGMWNGVFFDISEFNEKDAVNSLTISVRYLTYEVFTSDFIYYIDMLGAYRDPCITHTLKYLSSNYYTSNGLLTTGEDSMFIEITGENTYIETYSFNSAALAGATAIKLKFRSISDCTAVTLSYATALSPWFSSERNYILPVENDGDVQTCYFPINSSAEQIRFVFNDASNGYIEIYSIVPVAMTVPVSAGGTIDECVISSNKKEINISGTLTEDVYEDSRGLRLELYIFGMHENINIENRQPAAQIRVDRSFTFKIPVTNDRGDSYICSKFVVAVSSEPKFIIDSPKCIANPEILAASRRQHTKSGIKKGMTVGQYFTEAQLNGIKHTSVNINLSRYLTLTDSIYSYQFEGYTYNFSEDQINRLDSTLLNYYNAGINVTAVLSVQLSQDETINRLLIHPDADRTRNASGYAFNTETTDGIRCLRAFCEFLTKRYSADSDTHGRISNYAVGSKIDNMYQNYNMGLKTLGSFVSSYASAVRIVYNTIRSVSTAPNIYISLSSNWDRNISADSLLRYDGRSVLDAFAAILKNQGDINWNLVLDPYPSYAGEIYLPWNDNNVNAENSYAAGSVTMRNIETLCRYMLRAPLLYSSNSTPRSIILLESRSVTMNPSESELISRTAAYAYSYYKINAKACSLIESYIIPRQQSYNNVIKFIDTDSSEEKTVFALQVLGISEWSQLIPDYDPSLFKRRNVSEAFWDEKLPLSIFGTATMWNFSSANDTRGWILGENCANISSGNELSERFPLLKFQLLRNNIFNEYRGISNTFDFPTDLSCAPYISFNIQLTMLPVNVNRVELLVVFYSGNSSIELTGTVIGGDWNTVVCDLSQFSEIKTVERMKIWVRDVGGRNDVGDPVIFISNISVNSMEYSSDYILDDLQAQRELHMTPHGQPLNMTVVWLLITVIIVASSLLVINILSRRKVEDKDE